MIAIDQADRVFYIPEEMHDPLIRLRELLDTLFPVEKFYHELGGIVGYHWLILKFLVSCNKKVDFTGAEYHFAPGMNIAAKTKEVRQAVIWGVEKMSEMAEIYPVGGAADRLRLQDEKQVLRCLRQN